MRSIFRLSMAAIGVLHLTTMASGQFVPARFRAAKTSVAPIVDGALDDAIWAAVRSQATYHLDQFYEYKSGGLPAESPGSMAIVWDDDYLYVAMELGDLNILPSNIISGDSGHDAPLYKGDVIELFVRPDVASPQYYEFEWNAAGDTFDARFDAVRFGSPSTAWESNMESSVRVAGTIDNPDDVDQGWTVEVAIPLLDFGPVEVGTEWAFSFARYDFFKIGDASTSANLMMTTRGDPNAPMGGVIAGFHTYEIYDTLVFDASLPVIGDFNQNGELDIDDLNLLAQGIPLADSRFDVNLDGLIDSRDLASWVVDLKQTWFGDANLDGAFNSGDLVSVFQAGEYEDAIALNSNWATGDWSGDQDFTSGDLVIAFQDGGYEQGRRLPSMAVPEPSTAILALGTVFCLRRPRRLSNPFASFFPDNTSF